MDRDIDALLDEVRTASMEWQEDLNHRKTIAAEALERAENVLRDSAAIVAGMGDELQRLNLFIEKLRLAISTHRAWTQDGIDPAIVNEMLWKAIDD